MLRAIGLALLIGATYAELTEGFDGIVESGPGIKLKFESDPGLIFSVGFDYENFLRIDIEPGELLGDGADGEKDISFYYLFSSIRMYSIQLPRQQRVRLIWSIVQAHSFF